MRGLAFDQHRAALVLACFAEAVVATVGMVFDLDTVEMPTSRLAQNLIRLCYRLGYVPRTLRAVMAFVRGFGPLIIIDGAPLEEEERREKIWQGMRRVIVNTCGSRSFRRLPAGPPRRPRARVVRRACR